ncbi:hypothetical protein ACLOJK_006999 [Asimina triloba]
MEASDTQVFASNLRLPHYNLIGNHQERDTPTLRPSLHVPRKKHPRLKAVDGRDPTPLRSLQLKHGRTRPGWLALL